MQIILIGAALTMAGCVMDEIAITVTFSGLHPSFALKYVNEPTMPVGLHEFHVKELDGNRIIWKIRVMNWEREPVKTVIIEEIIFGVVPKEFVQLFPANDHFPELKDNKIYVAEAGGVTEGKTEFTMSQECRKVSLTSLSRNRVNFKTVSPC